MALEPNRVVFFVVNLCHWHIAGYRFLFHTSVDCETIYLTIYLTINHLLCLRSNLNF